MSKNLVVCCDGTNNSLKRPPTNVAQLSRLAAGVGAAQEVYYDAGVGVEASPGMFTVIGKTVSRWSGLAFGTGLVDNVEQAYLYIVQNYAPGDQLFMFGFSRGAYTVRVIAGLLEQYGLLRRDQSERTHEVVSAYQRLYAKEDPDRAPGTLTAETRDRLRRADEIRRTSSVNCPIHFMGVFDTVSSLGWAYDPKTFPFTAKMPKVRTVRHALALDERRAKFRTNRVKPVQGQDVREEWFAGVHSDVGGGYEGEKGRLSRVPLRWMLREACAAGLKTNAAVVRELDLDATVAVDEQAEQNESLNTAWWALEYVPLPHRTEVTPGVWVDEKKVYRGQGWRTIRAGNLVSESLKRRKQPVKNSNWASMVSAITWEV